MKDKVLLKKILNIYLKDFIKHKILQIIVLVLGYP